MKDPQATATGCGNMRRVGLATGLALLVMTWCWGPALQLDAHAQDSRPRAEAYRLWRQGALPEAADQFALYLRGHPDDLQTGLDYSELLLQLRRPTQACAWLEQLLERHPDQEPAHFRLGIIYIQLQRYADATRVFTELQQSTNPAMARAAEQALSRLQHDQAREQRFQAESRVFALADQGDHAAVVAAVHELEQQGPVSYPVAMQRLYALYNLGRFQQALPLAETLARQNPQAVEPAFLQAELLVQLQRPAEAVSIWREMETRLAGQPAAAEARRRRLVQQPPKPLPPPPRPPAISPAEEAVFSLARDGKDRDVLTAVDAMERDHGQVSWLMERQRLYALYNLRQFGRALARADILARTPQADVALAFLRAELLMQLNRPREARAIWEQIEMQHPGTPDAREARLRRQASDQPAPAPPPPYRPTEEDRIFALATAGRHREVAERIDRLENEAGPLSFPMELQRLYALQAMGNQERAAQQAEALAIQHPEQPDLTLIRADLLTQSGQSRRAGALLSRLEQEHAGEPVAGEARRRLRALPALAQPDKWYWGEAYLSGTYFGRYGAVAGSGLARQGAFVPGARRIQPYLEFRFGVDTKDLGPERTLVVDNHVGLYGGVRVQILPTEYLFLYGQGGINQDLSGTRQGGDWTGDFQAGAYGFKSWGPGRILLKREAVAAGQARGGREWAGACDFLWRGDWWVDVGADFSYYDRYESWIGYGQAHEGWRLFQCGPAHGFDLYLVENLSWDVRGNYWDNLVELGPGVRWLWSPCPGGELILRAEWLNGFYMGRDELDTRGDASKEYDEIRVGLSLGMRW